VKAKFGNRLWLKQNSKLLLDLVILLLFTMPEDEASPASINA